MRSSIICFIFMSVASVCLARPQRDVYSNQDGFVFPGVADRPDKFPINPHNPGWQDPGINGGNNGGLWHHPGNTWVNNGDFWLQPGNGVNNGGSWQQPGNGANNGGSWQQPGNGANNGGSWQQPGNGANNGGSWQPPTTNNWNTNTTPTTQAPPVTSGAGQTATDSPAYTRCFNSCQTTSEYNPICGSDNVVYSNPGKFNCANACGKTITQVKRGQCPTTN